MLIQQDKGEHKLHITRYAQAEVTINQTAHPLPLAITPDRFLDITLPVRFLDMNLEIIAQCLEQKPEVFIIGTGAHSQFLPPAVEQYCLQRGQAIDTMSTAAACRTFTLLATEGRKVLTLLFAE